MIFNPQQLIDDLKIRSSHKKYRDVYTYLKPYLKDKITEFLDSRKISNRGRKRTINWDKFLDCMFCISDNGLKMSYIKELFDISKSTYYYYFSLISEAKLLEQIHSEFVKYFSDIQTQDYVITDTFTVKSMDGSEGVGRNPTDRGRKGIKVSLICDQRLVTHAVHLESANVHDSKILIPTINVSVSNLKNKKCLADSGYAGQKYITKVNTETDIQLISKPKKTNNRFKMSHIISTSDTVLLEKKRNNIERLNGNIRRFRGLMIKYTKKISSYLTYLYVALLCITCYGLFIYS
jgi:hypothetical protein